MCRGASSFSGGVVVSGAERRGEALARQDDVFKKWVDQMDRGILNLDLMRKVEEVLVEAEFIRREAGRERTDMPSKAAIAGFVVILAATVRGMGPDLATLFCDALKDAMERLIDRASLAPEDEGGIRDIYNEVRKLVEQQTWET